MVIENDNQYDKIYSYMKEFAAKRDKVETDDTLMYTEIPMVMAIENRILYSEFLFHPLVLKIRKFYEDPKELVSKKQLAEKIAQILEIELTSDKTLISDKVLKKLISAHKRLTKNKTKSNETIK